MALCQWVFGSQWFETARFDISALETGSIELSQNIRTQIFSDPALYHRSNGNSSNIFEYNLNKKAIKVWLIIVVTQNIVCVDLTIQKMEIRVLYPITVYREYLQLFVLCIGKGLASGWLLFCVVLKHILRGSFLDLLLNSATAAYLWGWRRISIWVLIWTLNTHDQHEL